MSPFAVLCWAFKESHYNPYAQNKNTNGTYDNGMCQINDVCWEYIYAKIPDKLKKLPNPKFNAEVSIAMIYLWVNDRVEQKMSWSVLS